MEAASQAAIVSVAATETSPLLLAPFPPLGGAAPCDDRSGDDDAESPEWLRALKALVRNEPPSARGAAVNALFSAVLFFSIILLCLGTVPAWTGSPGMAITLFVLNVLSILVFTVEFAIDVMIYPHSNIHMILNPIFIIDFLAIFPFYLEIIVSILSGQSIVEGATSVEGFAALRVLRLLRVFRLFKFFDKSSKLRLLGQALAQSSDGILVLVLVAPLLVVFFATLSFYAEQTDEYFKDGVWYYSNGDRSQFQSIPDAFWLTIVTLTTVGYGDVTPRTQMGRFVSALASLTALVFLAFPLTVITSQYSSVLEADKVVEQEAEEERRKREDEEERHRRFASLNSLTSSRHGSHDKLASSEVARLAQHSHATPRSLPVASVLDVSRHEDVVHLRISINGEEGMRRVMQVLADITSVTPLATHHSHSHHGN